MGSLKPAGNIIFGFIGGGMAVVALHYAKLMGYDVSPDIASGLPGAIAVLLAHVWDVSTGENKK